MRRALCLQSGAATLALLLVCAAGVAWGGTARAAGALAYWRVVHAGTSVPGVDIYVQGTAKPLATNFVFGQVTDYWPVPAGSYGITLTPAGQPTSAALITATLATQAGQNYTLAIIGDSAHPPKIVTFLDDNTIASGMAQVRVYHLSPDAGLAAVSVGGQTVIPKIDFEQASSYLTVKPGSYTFDLQLATKTVPLAATLEANKVTSVFGVGSVNGGGSSAFKFVVVTAPAMPTGMPDTGFDPHPATASAGSERTSVFAWLAVLAVLASGCYLWLSRRTSSRSRAVVVAQPRQHRLRRRSS